MAKFALLVVFATLFAFAYAQNITLEFNNTFIYDEKYVLDMTGRAPGDWKDNQTVEGVYQMVTNTWIFQPSTNETGSRFSTIRVSFDEDCYKSFNKTKLQLIMYPFGYPAVSPNLSSGFIPDLPSFATIVSVGSFDNDTHTYAKNYSSGEVFIGWSCCMSIGTSRKTGEYVIMQKNMTSCHITVEAFGPTVLVSSLKLFYGTLLLILVPALITIIAHFLMLICQRSASDKSEASFKRANCECRLFWLVWVVAFAVYIGAVMVPLY